MISVILASPTVLAEECEDEHESETPYQGVWDWERMTIWINSKLSSDQRWATLWHELQHAVTDIKDYDATYRAK